MATPTDNIEHVKRIITESETFLIALDRLGLTVSHYAWIVNFAKLHKVKTKIFR